uniref:Septin-type G domain-containing protein n=1 Tax=Cyprinodon variegatus TaxID=28743 RepID=A0A3Q2CCU7_CYPVA
MSITSASSASTPVSPSSSHFILNHNKAIVEQRGGGQPDSLRSLSLGPSPLLKSRAVGSSLSFNRGTMNRPVVPNNSSSVTRAASFQSRLNPNFCSTSSGPGSDNDSLYSSTSSLEYSSGGGYTLPANRLTSYNSPPPQRDFYGSKLNWPQQRGANMEKFSSLGGVFKPEVDQDSELTLHVTEPHVSDRGTVSILDFQLTEELTLGMAKDGAEGRMSPGMKYVDANANWNGRPSGYSSEESGSKEVYQQRLWGTKSPPTKAKETRRLNKFPLDLDSLVSSISPTSPTKPQAGLMSPKTSNCSQQSSSELQNYNLSPPSTATSPSASLHSLDSSSETSGRLYNHPRSPISPSSPVPSHHPITAAERSCSPESLHQMDHYSKSQVGHMVLNLHLGSSSTSGSRVVGPLADGECDGNDSVDLILQRIASFSVPGMTDINTGPAVQTPKPSAGSSSESDGPTETRSTTRRLEGTRKHGETAEQLLFEPSALMEERGEKQNVTTGDGEQNIQSSRSEKESCMEEHEEPVKEKGMETEESRRESELEAEVKLQLCPSAPGLIRGTDLFGYVGIEAVLDQMRRKTMKAGFEFNIMVVGQSGLGKSTLVNTLFKSKVSRKSCSPNYEDKISKTVKLHAVSHGKPPDLLTPGPPQGGLGSVGSVSLQVFGPQRKLS